MPFFGFAAVLSVVDQGEVYQLNVLCVCVKIASLWWALIANPISDILIDFF
jgi:hypothetical protein